MEENITQTQLLEKNGLDGDLTRLNLSILRYFLIFYYVYLQSLAPPAKGNILWAKGIAIKCSQFFINAGSVR